MRGYEGLRPMYDYADGDVFRPWQVIFKPTPPRLRPFVDSLISYPSQGSEVRFSRVPEGIAHVVCLLTHATGRGHHGEGAVRAGALLVSGPHAAKHPMIVGDETMVAQLRPGAARVMLGVEAAAIANQVVSAEELWGTPAREVLARIAAAPSRAARLDTFTAFLHRRLRTSPADDLFALRAAAWMQGQAATSSLTVLATRSGYSDRQTRRKFQESLGLSPKVYARTLRLRAVLQSGARGADWAAVALAAGFYDQSHLVHEFKNGLGLPPAAFFERPRLSALSRFGILDET